ncbi:MAG: HD domain-containing protein [Myxococcota bacterium]
MSRLVSALRFAAQKHRMQRRKDAEASPYINHPIDVAHILLVEAGVDDVVTLMAAVLHDTIEDTETSAEELEQVFGTTVKDVVLEVTDDKSLPKLERKRLQIEHAPHLSERAQLVKMADKIANLRDVRIAPPAGWSEQRVREYYDWAKAVVDPIRARHPGLAGLFDGAFSGRPKDPPGRS